MFEGIDLTYEETQAALFEGKKQKYFRIKSQEYWRKVNQDQAYPNYTAEEVFKFLSEEAELNSPGRRGAKFVVDAENEAIIKTLCLYFSNDKRFEQRGENFSLNKGLLLMGGVGVGKTEIMEFFYKNPKQSYVVISARDIEKAYADSTELGGDIAIAKYGVSLAVTAVNSDPFGHKTLGYCFDDLGTEPAVTSRYGTTKSVMADVILNRYDGRKRHDLSFFKTHITTNLNVDEMRKNYGDRVLDRMMEMFNEIKFNPKAKSRRV